MDDPAEGVGTDTGAEVVAVEDDLLNGAVVLSQEEYEAVRRDRQALDALRRERAVISRMLAEGP